MSQIYKIHKELGSSFAISANESLWKNSPLLPKYTHNVNSVKSCMNYLKGTHRYQTYIATLDDQVSADNAVRLMDAFIDKLDLAKLGFTNTVHKSEGRPSYIIINHELKQASTLKNKGSPIKKIHAQ